LAGCWSDGVAGAWLAVVGALVVVDWAVAEPLIRAAPIPPPRRAVPVRPTPMRVLRRGCNLVSYRCCPTCSGRQAASGAGLGSALVLPPRFLRIEIAPTTPVLRGTRRSPPR